ncbi:AfsR/SARP family transcriptional regulator [Streptomyces sp. 6N223]|uniref:AfsR/SARP family transcriptional regulator n=1 Tax=Streptomyces sp. 6N223 TaxID=3457412 RepID=UPI003FCFDAA2
MAVEFTVLGDVEARIDGSPVDLGHVRRQCVLVGLLVDANRVVPLDRLADRVWGERAPRGARQALYSYLSRLRTALSHEQVRIARRPGGYVLSLEGAMVDLHRFRGLIAEARRADGDAGRATALREQALALWRGEAFASLDTPWLNDLRDTLHQERLAAELDRNDLLLRQGRQGRLLAELRERAAQHPLNERLAAQLMLALYRDGRAADALACYDRVRRDLAEELGTDPAPELRRLHRRILNADPALAGPPAAEARAGAASGAGAESGAAVRSPAVGEAPRQPAATAGPVPRQLPPPPRQLIGREAELAALTDALPAAGTGMAITVICGVGGIGKTSLALRWGHDSLSRFPDGQLHADLRGFDPALGPVEPEAVVRAFLVALGVDGKAVPADPVAQVGLYRSLMADKRMLVLLDNARDADQVRPLLPGSPRSMVLITSRDRLGGLLAAEDARPLPLGTLRPDEARRLFTSRLSASRVAAEPDAVRDIVASCARLPLALAVAGARALASPALPLAQLAAELRETETRLDALDTGDLATCLRAAFDSSHRALDPTAARLFLLLGLAPGQDTGLRAAAALAALTTRQARVSLRTLEGAHLVQQHAPGRFRMHDLVRLYAADRGVHDLRAAEREDALGRLIGYFTHTSAAGHALLDPHGVPAPLDDPEGFEPHRPVDQAEAMAWFDAEHGSLLPVQRLALETGRHREAWRLAWCTDMYFWRRGHIHDSVASCRMGLAAVRRLPGPDATLDRAVAHRRLGLAVLRADPDPLAPLPHLRRALALFEETGDALNQAHTHQALAAVQENAGDDEGALRHAARSLELYRPLGDVMWTANALNTLGWFQARLGRYAAALANCRASLAVCQELGYREGEASAWDSLGYLATRTGRHAEAVGHYRRALGLRRALGDRYEEADALVRLGEAYQALGRHALARLCWRRALDRLRVQHRAERARRVEELLGAAGSTPGPGGRRLAGQAARG